MITLHFEFGACRKRKVVNIFFACLFFQGILILYNELDKKHEQYTNIIMELNQFKNISTGCDKINEKDGNLNIPFLIIAL